MGQHRVHTPDESRQNTGKWRWGQAAALGAIGAIPLMVSNLFPGEEAPRQPQQQLKPDTAMLAPALRNDPEALRIATHQQRIIDDGAHSLAQRTIEDYKLFKTGRLNPLQHDFRVLRLVGDRDTTVRYKVTETDRTQTIHSTSATFGATATGGIDLNNLEEVAVTDEAIGSQGKGTHWKVWSTRNDATVTWHVTGVNLSDSKSLAEAPINTAGNINDLNTMAAQTTALFAGPLSAQNNS